IYRKMFEFTLTKHDADFYYTYRNEFKANTFRKFLTPLLKEHHFSYGLPPRMEILDQDLARIERFYTTALKRDQILIERAVKKMEDEKESISVIVTGGFHTPGIETYLREQDYSYLIIAPRVEKKIDPEQSTRRYEDAIRQKPLPLEKLLMESYFLPSMTAIQNPQFQLAAELLLPNKEDEWERFVGHLASGRSTRGDEGKFNMLVDFISLVTADSAISGNPGEEIEAIRSELRKLPEIDRQPLDRLINRFSGVSFSHGVGSERVDYLFLPVLGEPNKLLAIASLPQAPDGRENRLYSEVRTQLRLRRNAFPVPLDTHILLFSSVIDRDRSPIFIPRAVDQALRVLAEELELASRAPQAVSISEEPKEVSEAEERPTDRQRDKKLLEEAREQFKTFRQTFGELGAWTDQEQRALQYHIFQLARRELGVPKPGGVAILPDGYDYELGYELGVPAAESLFYFSPAVKSWIASQLPYAWGAVSKEPFAIAPSLPSRVIEALDSPETFRFEVLLQGIRSDAAFSAYFLNALSNLTRHADVLDSLNLLPGDLWQNGEQGYIVVPYDEDVTDIRFLNRIADRAEREAPKSILRIIVPPELKSVASDLRSELRGRVEIQVDDLGRHVRGLEKRVANIIQIRAGPLRHLDIEMLQASLLGAVALSQGTILVLGADEQVSSYAIVVDSVEILQDMLLSVLEAQKAA
ncbi:MAG: hypothetical protein Q8R76_13195, partial [Candidatus Omnitrophota bacterium]|nr:hypothetical protein [Candidatus Omnitrophota bacterium]